MVTSKMGPAMWPDFRTIQQNNQADLIGRSFLIRMHLYEVCSRILSLVRRPWSVYPPVGLSAGLALPYLPPAEKKYILRDFVYSRNPRDSPLFMIRPRIVTSIGEKASMFGSSNLGSSFVGLRRKKNPSLGHSSV